MSQCQRPGEEEGERGGVERRRGRKGEGGRQTEREGGREQAKRNEIDCHKLLDPKLQHCTEEPQRSRRNVLDLGSSRRVEFENPQEGKEFFPGDSTRSTAPASCARGKLTFRSEHGGQVRPCGADPWCFGGAPCPQERWQKAPGVLRPSGWSVAMETVNLTAAIRDEGCSLEHTAPHFPRGPRAPRVGVPGGHMAPAGLARGGQPCADRLPCRPVRSGAAAWPRPLTCPRGSEAPVCAV